MVSKRMAHQEQAIRVGRPLPPSQQEPWGAATNRPRVPTAAQQKRKREKRPPRMVPPITVRRDDGLARWLAPRHARLGEYEGGDEFLRR